MAAPPIMSSRKAIVALLAVAVVAGAAAALYMFALPGLSSARPESARLEVAVATWLLRHSVPAAAAEQHTPLGTDPADIAAGHDLFQKNCEICNGYNGNGKTRASAATMSMAPQTPRSYVSRRGKSARIVMARTRRTDHAPPRSRSIRTIRRIARAVSAPRATCRRSSRQSRI